MCVRKNRDTPGTADHESTAIGVPGMRPIRALDLLKEIMVVRHKSSNCKNKERTGAKFARRIMAELDGLCALRARICFAFEAELPSLNDTC